MAVDNTFVGRKPRRRTSGFTLIELLITMVIVGLLAAIAIPRLSATKGRGFVASMKSDLRNFAAYEESYFYDHAVYTPSLAALEAQGYQRSAGVAVTIVEATVSGWAVTSRHPLVGEECALFVGSAAPVGAATVEGEIACQ